MKIRLINETVTDQINQLSQKYNLPTQEIVNQAKTIHPKYSKYVINQWYQEYIKLPEDAHRVQETLAEFDKHKKLLPNKDINQYKRLSDIETAIDTALGRKQETFIANLNRPGVKIINQVGKYTVVEITDPEALKDLGEGTKWCTRRSYPNCRAESYLENYRSINIIFKEEKPFIQYTPDYTQIMDRKDNSVEIWLRESKIHKLIKALIPPPQNPSPEQAYEYARHILRARWPEAEPIIKKDPKSACYYTFHLVKRQINEKHVVTTRWPEAEPYIMKNPVWAMLYVKNVIKVTNKANPRWPEAEPYIKTEPQSAVEYATTILRQRWPEAEPSIIKYPILAVEYAKNAIKGRWPEAEPKILTSPRATIEYAEDVIKDRWPEAEPIILQVAQENPMKAVMYAWRTMKQRWPEAEPYIKTDPESAYWYADKVIEGRWPEAEPTILKDPEYSKEYKILMKWWKNQEK